MSITGREHPRVIRIVCNGQTGHPARRPEVTVATYRLISEDIPGVFQTGRWTEDNRSPRLNSSGRTLVGTELYDRTVKQPGPMRSNYRFECPKHPGRGVQDLTEPKLFRALNHAREHGLEVLSLQALGGIVERMERSRS